MENLVIVRSAPKLAEKVEIIASDDGFVVHDANRNVVHYLNQTAAIVLSLCDGKRSKDEIGELLRGQFDLGESPLADVDEILSNFENEGLVDSADGRPGPEEQS